MLTRSSFGRTLLSVLVLSIVVSVGWAQQAGEADARVRYDGHKVVRALIRTEQDLVRMHEISPDVWTHGEGIGPVDFRVPPENMDDLDASGIPYEVLIEDVQVLIEQERSYEEPTDGEWFNDFRDFETILARMEELAAMRPDIAEVFEFGQSLEGRPMTAMKITGPGGGDKPALVFNHCQHAREWITPMAAMFLADELISNYGVDDQLTNLVNNLEFYIIPVTNPDGYVYTWTTERMWRKNRRNNGNGTWGVDLNRNWSVGFGGEGSSGRGRSETYRGPEPFSEPETQALRDLMASLPNLTASNDVHSYGQLVLQPYGYSPDLPPDHDELDYVGGLMDDAMTSLYGEYWVHGPTYWTIYPASGIALDWSYEDQGALGYSFELRDRGNYGFLLPANQIVPASEECMAGNITMAQYVLDNYGGGGEEMFLEVGELIAGENGQFDVVNAIPETMTYLAYSLSGMGSTYVPPLNVTLDLSAPKQAGEGQLSDGSGAASWTLFVPPIAQGRTVWFQACQFENKSNVVEAMIN